MRAGDARNAGAPGANAVDPATPYAGLPPTQGMKYLLSKGMRDRSQTGHDA
jgi:hypothetical protein